MISSRSKEESNAKGDRESHKGKCQNGKRCHGAGMVLLVTSLASMALVASMASMASMASRALVVAAIVPLDWMNGMLAEFIRLTPRCEEIGTGTLEMVSRMIEWMALLTLLVTSINSLALMESMVALLDLFAVLMVSLASMVASGARWCGGD